MKDKIRIGIGFATGRKTFKRTLTTYIKNWQEGGILDKKEIEIHLFVAYDLKYKNTKKRDFQGVPAPLEHLVDGFCYIGERMITKIENDLIKREVISKNAANYIFENGYGALRNAILYKAIEEGMDYLLFIDDDEYPVAVTKNSKNTLLWSGQQVLGKHLENISKCDISHGYHCGYISPIPSVSFDDGVDEEVFRKFILALGNDIVNWDTVSKLLKSGGVTYADKTVLKENKVKLVRERNMSKFISGSNLCINLKDPTRTFPFYNPPGARGEDTFLATCLLERKVLKLPVYAFHDGFDTYNHILDGVLPAKLTAIKPDNKKIIDRFYKACIGWIRYKPLFLYITDKENYKDNMLQIKTVLSETIPHISNYFKDNRFRMILRELKKYDLLVEEHYENFQEAKKAWNDIVVYLLRNK